MMRKLLNWILRRPYTPIDVIRDLGDDEVLLIIPKQVLPSLEGCFVPDVRYSRLYASEDGKTVTILVKSKDVLKSVYKPLINRAIIGIQQTESK